MIMLCEGCFDFASQTMGSSSPTLPPPTVLILSTGLTLIFPHSFSQSSTAVHLSYQLILFLILERKLEKNEFPHNLYIRSYSASSTTCLALRKWIFTLARVCTRLCLFADLLLTYF